MSRGAEGKVMVECGDENARFSGFFVKTLFHRFPDFNARGFLHSHSSFFSRKTREMKIDLRQRGKDRNESPRIAEDFAVPGRRTFPSEREGSTMQRTTDDWPAPSPRPSPQGRASESCCGAAVDCNHLAGDEGCSRREQKIGDGHHVVNSSEAAQRRATNDLGALGV